MFQPENGHVEEQTTTPAVNHDDIAALAHQLWQRRGAPEGSAEEDWHQAESLLTEQR